MLIALKARIQIGWSSIIQLLVGLAALAFDWSPECVQWVLLIAGAIYSALVGGGFSVAILVIILTQMASRWSEPIACGVNLAVLVTKSWSNRNLLFEVMVMSQFPFIY